MDLPAKKLRFCKHFILDGSYDVMERGLFWVVAMAKMDRQHRGNLFCQVSAANARFPGAVKNFRGLLRGLVSALNHARLSKKAAI